MNEPKKRETPKRLVIDIDDELHTTVKLRATARNITMRQWVLRALVEAIRREEKYD